MGRWLQISVFCESRKFGKVTDAAKGALTKISAKVCWSPGDFRPRSLYFLLGKELRIGCEPARKAPCRFCSESR